MKRRAVLIGAAATTLAGTIEPVHAVVPYRPTVRTVVSWEIAVEFETDALRVDRRFSDGQFLVMWIPRSWLADNFELSESYRLRLCDIQRFFDAIDVAVEKSQAFWVN